MTLVRGIRIVKTKYESLAFTGEGAKEYGGRWNSRGRACVYLASSESLAILEILVHVREELLLQHYSLFEVDLPAEVVLRVDLSDLPNGWDDPVPSASSAKLGDGWLETSASAVLAIPSAVVPRERNYLLNPSHPDSAAIIRSARKLPFNLDPRLKTR